MKAQLQDEYEAYHAYERAEADRQAEALRAFYRNEAKKTPFSWGRLAKHTAMLFVGALLGVLGFFWLLGKALDALGQ